MTDKYCPAGKINCEYFESRLDGEQVCTLEQQGSHHKLFIRVSFEQCPWPSKQKPIEDKKVLKGIPTDTAILISGQIFIDDEGKVMNPQNIFVIKKMEDVTPKN